MVDMESYMARLDALEQAQRRIVLLLRILLFMSLMLTALTCWQQWHNHWLSDHNQRLIELMRLMQPFTGPPTL